MNPRTNNIKIINCVIFFGRKNKISHRLVIRDGRGNININNFENNNIKEMHEYIIQNILNIVDINDFENNDIKRVYEYNIQNALNPNPNNKKKIDSDSDN